MTIGKHYIWFLLLFHHLMSLYQVAAFVIYRAKHRNSSPVVTGIRTTICFGWLENFFEPEKTASSSSSSSSSDANSRQMQYPEQYPATYELNDEEIKEDINIPDAKLVRTLLKNTQLETRPIQIVYDANRDGWNPSIFHNAVDGKGACIIFIKDNLEEKKIYGGYNPKGYSSLGGARPSVAAFLFYEIIDNGGEKKKKKFHKLRKVGGGGLACARDDPDFGISFGPDSLVISLQSSNGNGGRQESRIAQSKLGPYFEKGPEDLSSLFANGGSTELSELKVFVGCYDDDEDIPYSGGVLDMTSG
ncbi:MAG: hypothetical protein ACI90V_003270 [Bacillariaceae sp.]|jgi:hypothetical protein